MAAYGRFTGRDLSELSALSLPWHMENGQMRPAFSQAAAQLSLELSAAAYDLDEENWFLAGWQDILYRGEERLPKLEETGHTAFGIGGYMQNLFTRFRHGFAGIHHADPGKIREEKYLEKTLIMAHALPDGRYVIAFGLMGTEKKLSDWSVNFRLAETEGLHQGFSQVSAHLEERLKEIEFPETAKRLGLDQLTLQDIVAECTHPNSRFLLWMSGHSQGAAVMQIFALHLIRGGVLPEYIIGYGFASPSVLYSGLPGDITDFPLYHIINRDDVVPRMGARAHIGRREIFEPDPEMRANCFGEMWENENFRYFFALMARVNSTEDALIFLYALLQTMKEVPDEDILPALSGTVGKWVPDKWAGALGGRIEEMLLGLQHKLQQIYLSVSTDSPLPMGKANLLSLYFSGILNKTGPKEFLKEALYALSMPHHLRDKAGRAGKAPYAYIVNERFYDLRPGLSDNQAPVWRGKRERKRHASSYSVRFAAYSAARINMRGR